MCSVTPQTDDLLILHFQIDFKCLVQKGKAYPWPRISRCPRCGGCRVWGHGYVGRYFDGEPLALWMKRYRCADCGAVHTARPESHWRGFLAPWSLILVSLLRKLKGGRWFSLISRQRQQYWWRGFSLQAHRLYGGRDMAFVLREMVRLPLIAATHSLKYFEIIALHHPPHRIFAATGIGGYG